MAALAVPIRLVSRAQSTNFLHYKLIDMGTFGGPNSSSPGLNALGVAAGWSATTIPMIPTSNPLVCGGVDHIGSVVTLAFKWQNGILTNLGALPGPHNCSEPFSVNDFGAIAGTSENGEVDPRTGGNVTRAVVWKNGQIQDLGSLGGSQNIAFWINNSEQVVGWGENTVPDPFSMIDSLFFMTPNGLQTRAVLWDHGQVKDLGTLGGPDAIAGFINDLGQVAGSSYTSAIPNLVTGLPSADPFLWEPPSPQFPKGRMIDLGSFGGANGFSNALNNIGQVIGGSSIASNPGACFFLSFHRGCHPFLWDNGTLIDLNTNTIGGNPLSADWFNDAGEIVGAAAFPRAQFDAYLWRNGVATDLGHLQGDCFSRAWGINSLGQVVGDSYLCSTKANGNGLLADHAFLWENGQLADLNALIPRDSPLVLVGTGPLSDVDVPNINDRGEIVGVGVPPGCKTAAFQFCGHAFLLIPVCADGTEGCADAPLDPAVVQASALSLTQPTANEQPFDFTSPTMQSLHRRTMPWSRGLGAQSPK
jgi:probable HAF family extracellular repeat protein